MRRPNTPLSADRPHPHRPQKQKADSSGIFRFVFFPWSLRILSVLIGLLVENREEKSTVNPAGGNALVRPPERKLEEVKQPPTESVVDLRSVILYY